MLYGQLDMNKLLVLLLLLLLLLLGVLVVLLLLLLLESPGAVPRLCQSRCSEVRLLTACGLMGHMQDQGGYHSCDKCKIARCCQRCFVCEQKACCFVCEQKARIGVFVMTAMCAMTTVCCLMQLLLAAVGAVKAAAALLLKHTLLCTHSTYQISSRR